jgi:hypothetical protein
MNNVNCIINIIEVNNIYFYFNNIQLGRVQSGHLNVAIWLARFERAAQQSVYPPSITIAAPVM